MQAQMHIEKIRSVLSAARSRCENSRNRVYRFYGGRGISCKLSLEEVKDLWVRDGADKMEKPSLDRLDPDKDYTYENCRFIEWAENARRGRPAYSVCGPKIPEAGSKPGGQATIGNPANRKMVSERRRWLKNRGMKIPEFADAIGLSYSTVVRWFEYGRTPLPLYLEKVKQAGFEDFPV